MRERLYIRLFLLAPFAIVVYFTYRIFSPFLHTIALAIVLATLCHPVYRWISRRVRRRDSLAALATCLLVLLVVVGPISFLVVSLATEVAAVYAAFELHLARGTFDELAQVRHNPNIRWVTDWLGQYVDLSQVDLVGAATEALRQVSVFLVRNSTILVGGVVGAVGNFLLTLVTMFFLLRDGSRLVHAFSSLTPISRESEELISVKFREVTRAVVVGSLVTALAQGAAGGLVFWLLGIPNVIFWSAAMALFSLVPVVGTAVVWVPWAIYLVLVGSTVKAIILVLAAVLFVGMIDNVVRPLFIEGQSGMHTLLVFFALMGGVAYFGVSGLIFGPIVVSLALTFIELFRVEFRSELSKQSP